MWPITRSSPIPGTIDPFAISIVQLVRLGMLAVFRVARQTLLSVWNGLLSATE